MILERFKIILSNAHLVTRSSGEHQQFQTKFISSICNYDYMFIAVNAGPLPE